MKRLIKSKKWLLAIGILFLVLLFLFLRKPEKEIASFTVQRGEIRQEISFSGKVDSTEKATLQFQQGGLMSWVGVKEGDFVRKNQPIASLDTRLASISLKKTLNLYSITRIDFDQLNKDYENYQENSDNDYREKVKRILQKNQFSLENSVLDVEAQDLAIKLSTISTPISGVVTKVTSPLAGVNISPSQAQFEIVNPDKIYFSVSVDQIDLVSVSKGKDVEVIFDAYPESVIQGKIESISFTPILGETGTVYEAKISFIKLDNKDLKYKIGMTGDVNIILEKRENTLFVPSEFVKEDSKGDYLLVGKKMEKVYVETGLESDTSIEIKNNINEGDIVYNI